MKRRGNLTKEIEMSEHLLIPTRIKLSGFATYGHSVQSRNIFWYNWATSRRNLSLELPVRPGMINRPAQLKKLVRVLQI